MDKPVVGVVVPFYNYGQYIRDCLQSIWTGQELPIEVMVIDDCSDPVHSSEAVKWCDMFPGTVYYKLEKNSGVSVARNTGIRMTSAPFITCLDADDMLTPGSLKKRFDVLCAHPELGMVYGNAYKLNEERGNSEWTYEQCMASLSGLQTYSRWLNTQTLLWRRSVYEQNGLYYEGLRSKEDKEFIVRLGLHPDFSRFKRRVKTRMIKNHVAIYRRHEGAKHRRRIDDKAWFAETERAFEARLKDLRKNGISKENTPWL